MDAGRKILLLVCAAVFAAWMTPAFADKRVALVIGNSNYTRVTRLSNPENDAEDISSTLRGLNFDVIFRTNLDQRGLTMALEEFERKAAGADTALFFFAGHGLQNKGQNYLLPIDTDVEDEVSLKYNTLPIERVRDALSEVSGVKIMVLDACRNNPLTQKLVRTIAGLTRSASVPRGLARLDRAEGMVVAYATQADDVAQDGSGRNSPFSAALNRRLAEPNLEIATLFRRVAQDVYEQTGGKQRPELSISLLQDFYLNFKEDDSQAWRRLGSDPSEADLRAFIAKFPTSPFVRDAQNRLYILESAVADEKKRQDIARLEGELKQLRQREEDRLAAQKAETERRNRDREETERLAVLQREKERMGAERRDKEQKDAERREQARLEQLKRDSEKLAAEREAEAKKAADKLEQQRIAAEKAEKARLEAERARAEAAVRKQQEAARLDAERREKERLAADETERKRIAAERLAAQEQEKARIEKEQREAAALEQKRLAAQKAEAERQEKERIRIARLEEDNRRKAAEDADKQHQAQVCADEKTSLIRLSEEKNTAELKKLRSQAQCSALVASIDGVIGEILKAQENACRAENRAFRQIADKDFRGLKLFVASATCADVKKEAGEKVARLETENAKVEAACAADDKDFQQLHARLQNKEPVYRDLKGLQDRLQCDRLRDPVAEAVRLAQPAVNTPEQVKSAQLELQRIGCYAGSINGEFNGKIKTSLRAYWTAKGVKSGEIAIDDPLVGALKGEPAAVCHLEEPAVVEQPEQPEKRVHKPASVEREEEPAHHKHHPVAQHEEQHEEAPVRHKHHPVAQREEQHEEAPVRRRHEAPAAERPARVRHAAAPAPARHEAAHAPAHHAAPAPGPSASAHHSPGAIMGTGF